MPRLNFPEYDFRLKYEKDIAVGIFDPVRRKTVALTPEEWVRQHMMAYLHYERAFPFSLMKVEGGLSYNKMDKRADIVLHDSSGKPFMLVECKAPSVKLVQEVFDQAAMYNTKIRASHLLITNGLNHYCAVINENTFSFTFIKDIPFYPGH